MMIMALNPKNSTTLPRKLANNVRKIWTALLLGLVFSSLSVSDVVAAQPRIAHVVIIWLKRPNNARDQETLIRASRAFRRIRGVIRVEAGKGMPVERPTIEQQFDVGVIITFKNRAALERYEKNSRHLTAVGQILAPLARRYIVFNSSLD